MGLHGNLRALIELESGSNDPMAIFLTTALLMTDALASWLVRAIEADDRKPVEDLLAASETALSFPDFVERCRNDGRVRMRNDDVALVRVTVERVPGR